MNKLSTPFQPQTHELLLNGFHFSLSAETFVAQRMVLPDNKQLKDLRAQHPDWTEEQITEGVRQIYLKMAFEPDS